MYPPWKIFKRELDGNADVWDRLYKKGFEVMYNCDWMSLRTTVVDTLRTYCPNKILTCLASIWYALCFISMTIYWAVCVLFSSSFWAPCTRRMLHFEAFEQKFSIANKGLTIRTFKENTDVPEASASSCTKNLWTLTGRSALITKTELTSFE